MIDRLRSIMARALHKYHEYKKRQSLIEKLLPSTIIVCEQVDHAESLLKQQQRHSQENLSVQQRLEEAETLHVQLSFHLGCRFFMCFSVPHPPFGSGSRRPFLKRICADPDPKQWYWTEFFKNLEFFTAINI